MRLSRDNSAISRLLSSLPWSRLETCRAEDLHMGMRKKGAPGLPAPGEANGSALG